MVDFQHTLLISVEQAGWEQGKAREKWDITPARRSLAPHEAKRQPALRQPPLPSSVTAP